AGRTQPSLGARARADGRRRAAGPRPNEAAAATPEALRRAVRTTTIILTRPGSKPCARDGVLNIDEKPVHQRPRAARSQVRPQPAPGADVRDPQPRLGAGWVAVAGRPQKGPPGPAPGPRRVAAAGRRPLCVVRPPRPIWSHGGL